MAPVMEKDGHDEKNPRPAAGALSRPRRLTQPLLCSFIHPHNQNSGSDWDGSASLFPKKQAFRGPFHFNRFSRHSRKNPYGLRPRRSRAQEDWPGLFYTFLFVLVAEIPDLIGMVPPVFSPKSRLFGAPFISIDFPGTAGKILTACGRGALAPKKTGPAFPVLFIRPRSRNSGSDWDGSANLL